MSVLNVPIDLIRCILFPFFTLKDIGVLSGVCTEWRFYIVNRYVKRLCDGIISNSLLIESHLSALELLDMWQKSSSNLACGENHGAMISRDGQVYLWKEGSKRNIVRGLSNKIVAKSVACGHTHTIVVASDNRAYTMGTNEHGQLGVGDKVNCDMLTLVNLTERVECARGGKDFTLFLSESNKLFWCGSLEVDGESEMWSPTRETLVPIELPFSQRSPKEKITRICAGASHILVLTNRNRLFSAGNAIQSQLGRLTTDVSHCALGEVKFPEDVQWPTIVQIAAGVHHSLVLFGDGSVYSFGKSSSGELGLPQFQDAAAPRLIPNLPKALAIGAGHQHSLILGAQSNKIVAFGLGALGQLGYRASFWSSSYPRDSVLPLEQTRRIKFISAGSGFSVCLSGDGQDLYACGKSSLCAGAGHGERSGELLPLFTHVPP